MTNQVINKFSKRKFGEIMSALANVQFALDDAKDLIADYNESEDQSPWAAIPDEDDLRRMEHQARNATEAFRGGLKKWEEKLIADGWKV